jgi:hypothetical protein
MTFPLNNDYIHAQVLATTMLLSSYKLQQQGLSGDEV